ncbi:hypothetical protein [Mucilaginibacter sp. PPCGB 2223]|uniref:hypothetical protein n=1 Tax=Mucilaginibacter sp. PPCGB 2223 TaxID=1886027 RepID=UPI00158691C3|nr:hypothetical protein [Mucilaginibacter sp. PPCGB 2223]
MKISVFVIIISVGAVLGIRHISHTDEHVNNIHRVMPNALKNMFGINAYEWNFLQNPGNLNDASHVYPPKIDLIKSFSQVRHYLDWEKIEPAEGSFTFNPANNGGWNYDAMYLACKQNNIEVLVCLKNCPPWLVKTYPAAQQGGENVPAPYGLDRLKPATYLLQAKAAFQFAARYGYNKNVPAQLVTVNTKPRWTADPVNEVKTGLGLIRYIECDNERDKWWKGKQAQQSAEEYAANLSAFYDGDQGRLSKDAGVKTADPGMQVVMGGLANPDPDFVRRMIDWCKIHRGYRKDGSVDLCFDVINYHFYPNDNQGNSDKQATRGKAPELTEAARVADSFVALADATAHRPEVWVTECGYDLNGHSPQRAIKIGNKTAEETQADWILRSALLFNRHGIKRLFFYQLFDDNPTSTVQYGTSGLTDEHTLKRRPAADYILQTARLTGNYTYTKTINNDPLVDVYQSGLKKMYVLMIPDEQGRSGHFILNLGTANAVIHTLKVGSETMVDHTQKTANGKLDVTVSETPVFIEGI